LDQIEIICINDGSTDESLKVLAEFQKRDSRIRMIDKPNGGVSSARNAGLEAAQGEFVRFLDGDDLLPLDSCEYLYECALTNGSDVLVCGYDEIGFDGIRKARYQFPAKTYHLENLAERRTVFSKFLSSGNQNQFFRSKAIRGIRFRPFSNGEDVLFFVEAVCRARVVSALGKSGYVYRLRQDSASRQQKLKMYQQVLGARAEAIRALLSVDEKESVEDLISRKILSWAVRDLAEISKMRMGAKEDFEALFRQWHVCYHYRILEPHKNRYAGEGLVRLIFRIDSKQLYLLIVKLIRFYFRVRSGIR
ncbi:MAG: glycosyltransferase, partial [bacterium]